MSYTPGPWRVNATPQSSNQNWVVLDSAPGHHKRVCAVYSSNDEADARLIAEAPAMLDLLKRAIARLNVEHAEVGYMPILSAWSGEAAAMIARIEGRS